MNKLVSRYKNGFVLFNPGPTNISDYVRDAMCFGDFCHREREVTHTISEVTNKIVEIVNGTGTYDAVLFASSGTGCNEAVISSIVGEVLIIDNGKYSKRLRDIVDRYSIKCSTFVCDPNSDTPIDIQRLKVELQSSPNISHVLMVHHETTTGILAPLKKIADLCNDYGKLLIVDAISSIGGHAIDLRHTNVDFLTVSMNKCLQGFPGISFVIGKISELKKTATRQLSLP